MGDKMGKTMRRAERLRKRAGVWGDNRMARHEKRLEKRGAPRGGFGGKR